MALGRSELRQAGRYFYEVRIVEILDPYDAQGGNPGHLLIALTTLFERTGPYNRVVQPRNLLRLGRHRLCVQCKGSCLGSSWKGFCTSSSSLFLGDTEELVGPWQHFLPTQDSVGFDSEGYFIHSRRGALEAT